MPATIRFASSRPCRRVGGAVAPLVAVCLATTAAAAEPKIDFSHDVVPVLKKHCITCHGGKEAKGGFSINSRESVLEAEVVAPGKADNSYLIELVESTDADLQMPPKDRPRVPAKELAVLRAWIDQGLKWEDGFTFAERSYEPPLKPRRPQLPPALDGRTNPVDRILDAYLAERKIGRSEPLDDAGFMRRLSLDLVGLLPTPGELQEFVADARPDKRERLLKELLADDRAYAEHWLTFWNDLLRNDYAGTGYIDGGRKQITGWLYRSLAENKPYDQFVRELIAPTPESEGFINGIKWRGNVNASQVREVQFAQNVSQVFLGINMKCASCHDSFVDHWKLEEAYGLAAIYSERSLEIHRCDKPTGKTAQAAWIFPELGRVDPEAPQPERLKTLAALMTHEENGRLTRTIVNRIWHRLMGRGIVHPVDAMHTEPWSADLLDYLAVHLADNGYDLKKTIEVIVTSQAYQSRAAVVDEEPGAGKYVYRGPLTKRMTAEQFVDSIWQITGAGPAKPDAPVQRAPAAGTRSRFVRAALMKSDLLMRSLGRPNREQVVTTRPPDLTTLQAIELANGQILADTLRRGAANILKERLQSADELSEWLFLYALSRQPTAEERELAREILGSKPSQQGVEDLLWAVFMLPEFQLIR